MCFIVSPLVVLRFRSVELPRVIPLEIVWVPPVGRRLECRANHSSRSALKPLP